MHNSTDYILGDIILAKHIFLRNNNNKNKRQNLMM